MNHSPARLGPRARHLLAAVCVAAPLAVSACSASTHDRTEPATTATATQGSPLAGNFVGDVDRSDAFIALVVDRNNHAVAYVCDGTDKHPAEVAEWFRGTVALDGRLRLTGADGTGLVADVTPDGVTGAVTLDGADAGHSFTLDAAEPPAGWYRAEAMIDGDDYVGGWIELANHDIRGAVTTRTSLKGADIDLARPAKPLNGFEGLPAEF
jgi:hypothetical protein